MDIETAIKHLKDRSRNSLVATAIDVRVVKLAIKALEQQLKDRWIPVSERLPSDKEINKLNYSHPNHRKFLCTIQIEDYKPQIRLLYFGELGWLYEGEKYNEYVKAWQPLPEPYKEKSNEN